MSGFRQHTNTYSKNGIKSGISVCSGALDMVENRDRGTEAWAHGPDADAGAMDDEYSGGNAKFSKSGLYAKATTGRAEGIRVLN